MMRNGKLFSIIALVIIAIFAYTAVYGLGPIKSVSESIKLGLDIEGGVVVVYEAQTEATGDDLAKIMTQTKGVLAKRVDQLGLTEPNIAIQGDDRIRIELPGVKNVQEAVDLIGKTAQLKFVRVLEDSFAYPEMTINDFKGELILTGENVKDAGISSDQYGNPAVSLEFDSEGTVLFRDATIAVVNYTAKKGQIAILLDDIVISAPATDEIIPSGQAIISGSFDFQYAQDLSSLIRGGALPVNLTEVQTSLIGPTLGKDALQYSVYAAGIGFALVVLFMIGYYRLPGVIASLTLVLYSSIVMFILVGLNATLTLPGMAGLVLSVGMAVDANVIIYERIKEEIKLGKTIRASIDSGFKRALRTIMDSNVTTLIAAVVLYYFGEGPIQGFAVTLMIGIGTSMFTAIVITRLFLKNIALIKAFNNKKLFGVKG
ncbi:MAG: protein translocase subunit SecD [Clostridiales bacterium]|nr:protein translocase subunit SecD [Clostridiales bacterium]